MNHLAGLRVIEDKNCYTSRSFQFRFPRSKKRRMRMKWAKMEQNWKWEIVPQAYRVGADIVAHPLIIQKLRIEFSEVAR